MHFHHILFCFLINLIHESQRVNKIKMGSKEAGHRCTGRGAMRDCTRAREEKRPSSFMLHPLYRESPATDKNTVPDPVFKVVISICKAIIFPSPLSRGNNNPIDRLEIDESHIHNSTTVREWPRCP